MFRQHAARRAHAQPPRAQHVRSACCARRRNQLARGLPIYAGLRVHSDMNPISPLSPTPHTHHTHLPGAVSGGRGDERWGLLVGMCEEGAGGLEADTRRPSSAGGRWGEFSLAAAASPPTHCCPLSRAVIMQQPRVMIEYVCVYVCVSARVMRKLLGESDSAEFLSWRLLPPGLHLTAHQAVITTWFISVL